MTSSKDIAREEFLAGRKAAGRLIDVETCHIAGFYVDIADPYGVGGSIGCAAKALFVASIESDGWIVDDDLPDDKLRELEARIDRRARTPATPQGVSDVLIEEYNCAVAALDDVIYNLANVADHDKRFANVPADVIRSAVSLALAKLGKEGTPLHEALERSFAPERREREGTIR